MANTKRISWYRVNVSVSSVGNATSPWVEGSVAAPIRGLIRRVRADVTAGASINQVAIQVRESAGALALNVPLEYALGAEPLDSEEEIYYEIAEGTDTNSRMGTLFFGVRVDNATTNHVVIVQFDIEPMG